MRHTPQKHAADGRSALSQSKTRTTGRRSFEQKPKVVSSDVYHGDARLLAALLPPDSVSVTITSPPYFDVKDYGTRDQIGFGQDYGTYLNDLQTVFGHILRATKEDGSLWIVIDTFRRDQEVLPLPFDVVAKLKDVGWVLRDVIIWKKERTVPWVHAGSTRRIFEYILVLAKTKKTFRYVVDNERDISDLKKWWVRYPERYNPRGKALEEIWSYDIPTQGSWGQKYVRHFCPLPSGLVSRIINLTTNRGDVVLDPFAGSGAVLAAAQSLNRKYVGFELNGKYIAMFRKYLQQLLPSVPAKNQKNGQISASTFEKLIKQLRMLKYARLLYRSAKKRFGAKTISHVFVRPLRETPAGPNKICRAEFLVLLNGASKAKKVAEHARTIGSIRPLSKFGVDPVVRICGSRRAVPKQYRQARLYLYSETNSHSFVGQANLTDALTGKHPIVSVIRASVEVPDG